MNNYRLYFLIIGVLMGGLSYLCTNSIYVTIFVSLLFIIYPQVFLVTPLVKYSSTAKKFYECYHFINSFIISLDVKGSISGAFNSLSQSMNGEFAQIYDGIKNFTEEEKINYLSKYYPFHIYSLFSKVVMLWQEEGGNILMMSAYLLDEGRHNVEYLNYCRSQHLSRIAEFIILWAFTLVILVVLRFALSQFFTVISQQLFYQVAIGLFFGFLLISIDVAVRKISKQEIRGFNVDE